MKKVSMFSWGYWGWGNATRQLIAAADAAERRRGYKPPLFVDIRYRRSVRAKGFSGPAFEARLPARRYKWMPELGNQRIGTRRGGIQIASPAAASDLFDLAHEASKRSQRVIFFCSCPSPTEPGNCHRHDVATLLRKAARRRGKLADVQEWPGGPPSASALTVSVSPEGLKAARRGVKAVPLKQRRVPADLVGLPWGTIVKLKAGQEEFLTVVGPAAYHSRGWVLPRISDQAEQSIAALRLEASRWRKRYGIDRKAAR